MAEDRKRKNSDGDPRDSNHSKRLKEHSGPTGSALAGKVDARAGPDRRRSARHLWKKTPARVPSSSPSPHPVSLAPEGPASSTGKDFYVYTFFNASYPSYKPPEPGTPGPVERFARISYPGEDEAAYSLDDGYVVPRTLVEEYDLHNLALQSLEYEDEAESSYSEIAFPPCGQPPRALSPSPGSPEPQPPKLKAWPPRHQGKPYVLVPSNPYILKPGHGQRQAINSSSKPNARTSKGKGRYIPSESEESLGADDDRDEDFVPSDLQVHDGDTSRGPSDHIEDAEEVLEGVAGDDSMIIDYEDPDEASNEAKDVRDGAESQDERVPSTDAVEVPEAWKRGGRPPKAFIKNAAAVGEAYHGAIDHLMKTYKVSQRVAHIATGLQPRVVETRETSSWNAHQRVYKMKNPKQEGESTPEFKTRQRIHYLLNVKPLTKDEKTEFREDCEAMVMEFFFKNQGTELRTLSPAKRVEAACKAMQKMAQMISRADHEIESFGGVNYVGPDKAGRASGGSTFVSSGLGLRAIKMFNIATKTIMLKTGDFLQAALAKQDMDQALEPQSSGALPLNHAKDKPDVWDDNNVAAGRSTGNEGQPSAGTGIEESHVALFNKSNLRKRGRSYLGLTYSKVDSQRSTVDWINLLANSVRGRFKFVNCFLRPHPGQKGFGVEKIPPKQWQEVGSMLTAEDFHPVTGGRNSKAPGFIPWTDEEKSYKKGTAEYNNIPIIVDARGQPLLTLLQAQQLPAKASAKDDGALAAAASDSGEENDEEGAEDQADSARAEAASTIPDGRGTARSAAAPRQAFHMATPPLEAQRHATRQSHAARPLQMEIVQQKPRKEDKQAQNNVPPLQAPLLTVGVPSAASYSRNLPHRGELGSTQHKKIVYADSKRQPPITSVMQAFFTNSNDLPPSHRGLAHPRPRPRPQAPAQQVGSARDSTSGGRAGTSQQAGAIRSPSKKPDGAQVPVQRKRPE